MNLQKISDSFTQFIGPSFWFTLIFMICWLNAGCDDNPRVDTVAAEENMQTGWLEYSKGNYAAALLSFERAISLDDSLADAHNGLGWSHLSASQSTQFNPQLALKAISAFQEAIRQDETNADAWIGLANALFLRRTDVSDFHTSIQALDNALKGDTSLLYRHDYNSAGDIHALKAANLYYAGEMEAARRAVELALSIDQNNKTAIAISRLSK